MIYVNITLILLFLILYAAASKNPDTLLKDIDKKEHKLYFLYPMSRLILDKTRLDKLFKSKAKVNEAVRALNVTGRPELVQRLYWYNKLSAFLLIIFLFDILAFLGGLQGLTGQGSLNGQTLIRPEAGEGSREIDLSVAAEASEDTDSNAVNRASYNEDITVTVNEREYTEAELNKEMDAAVSLLDQEVLGENSSKDEIRKDLNFINLIPGTGITVEWTPDDYDLISSDGKVINEDMGPEGKETFVTAALSYKDYKLEHNINLRILPRLFTEEEKFIKELKKELEYSSDAAGTKSSWKLPDSLNSLTLNWSEKKSDTGGTLFILGVVIALVFWFYGDRELYDRMKKRKDQMLMDYPDIINKFTLLIGAGMTIKQAWGKITEDYNKKYMNKDEKKGVKKDEKVSDIKRYAYEEMLVTAHELSLGIAEVTAYEQFGRRCGILPYMKFSTLIAQNLKKGNRGLAELLEREALEAFEERKQLAKRLGEEAGTKLLAPMMIMLLIVMVIIIIPAFISFRM